MSATQHWLELRFTSGNEVIIVVDAIPDSARAVAREHIQKHDVTDETTAEGQTTSVNWEHVETFRVVEALTPESSDSVFDRFPGDGY